MIKMDTSHLFLVFSIVIFLFIGFYTNTFDQMLGELLTIIMNIIPVFILVFILFVVMDYFVDTKQLVKFMAHPTLGYITASVAGVISTGPIYMWYPLLNDLQKSGIKNSLIAVFLYNRAIKPALIPMMILYFGLPFTVVLTIVMFIMSIFNGIVVEKILEVV